MELTDCGNGRAAYGDDALVITEGCGGIAEIVLKTDDVDAARKALRATSILTLDAEKGFIAVSPSGEHVHIIA